ncbi:MAG TPA: CidA/LrgA family protein [Candidatus Saccharimonadales bacterium]|nr:CidA/LrgA family protein [Candidatus Saccharimonadales bacterium]
MSAFQFAGAAVHALGVPMPGAVVGLVMFTASLFLGWVQVEWVESTSSFLLKHMLLFFVPMTVLTMRLAPMIKANWAALAVSILVSTIAVMVTTGLVADFLLHRKGAEAE